MLKENIQKIANFFRMKEQSQQRVEEMDELAQALSKYWRERENGQLAGKTEDECRAAIITELAYVKIMIYKIEYLLNGRDVIRAEIQRKIEREMKRMKKQNIRTCDNCMFEYTCDWSPAGKEACCGNWTPEDDETAREKEALRWTE